MEKTNYSVARVVTYTKQSIGKAERHNERKKRGCHIGCIDNSELER